VPLDGTYPHGISKISHSEHDVHGSIVHLHYMAWKHAGGDMMIHDLSDLEFGTPNVNDNRRGHPEDDDELLSGGFREYGNPMVHVSRGFVFDVCETLAWSKSSVSNVFSSRGPGTTL